MFLYIDCAFNALDLFCIVIRAVMYTNIATPLVVSVWVGRWFSFLIFQ